MGSPPSPVFVSMHRSRSPKQPQIDLEGVLPPPGSTRWGAWQKAAVVMAVRCGALRLSEAYDRYMLSAEELSRWEEAFDLDGIAGLRAGYFRDSLSVPRSVEVLTSYPRKRTRRNPKP
jgi:hypothetical protein